LTRACTGSSSATRRFRCPAQKRAATSFSPAAYSHPIAHAQEVVPILDLTLEDLYREWASEEPRKSPQARPFHLAKTSAMRELNPEGRPLAAGVHSSGAPFEGPLLTLGCTAHCGGGGG
jgi:hypothetical protein